MGLASLLRDCSDIAPIPSTLFLKSMFRMKPGRGRGQHQELWSGTKERKNPTGLTKHPQSLSSPSFSSAPGTEFLVASSPQTGGVVNECPQSDWPPSLYLQVPFFSPVMRSEHRALCRQTVPPLGTPLLTKHNLGKEGFSLVHRPGTAHHAGERSWWP